jgi:repressor LexA
VNTKKEIGKKLYKLRKSRKLSRGQLGELVGFTEYAVRDWEKGKAQIKYDVLRKLCEQLKVPVTYFLENYNYNEEEIKKDMIPILGVIRAGRPIYAQENIKGHIKLPNGVKADFALEVEGDSMTPVFYPGMLAYIRQQPIVENNEVAAVLVGREEATLKKVRFKNGIVELIPFNTKDYDVMQYRPEEISIIGKVVHPAYKGR